MLSSSLPVMSLPAETAATLAESEAEGREEPKAGERLSPLQVALRDGSGLSPLTALAFMVFTLIYTPCLGTIAMIRREAGSWGWAAFTVAYGLVLGWGMAWITVLAGRWLGFA